MLVSGVTVGLMVVARSSIAVSRPASAQYGSNGTGMFQRGQGYSRAPIGHRQPRPIDIPAVEPSPSDRALRQEDNDIYRKIVICRGLLKEPARIGHVISRKNEA